MKKFILVLALFAGIQGFALEAGSYKASASVCQNAGQVYDLLNPEAQPQREFSFSQDLKEVIERTTNADGSQSDKTFTLVELSKNLYMSNPRDVEQAQEGDRFFVILGANGQISSVYFEDFDLKACDGGVIFSNLLATEK